MNSPSILMVAAENGALPGGKAGGIGDVLRDVPPALAAEGCRVQVVTPGYGVLSRSPDMAPAGSIGVRFAGSETVAQLYRRTESTPQITQWVIEHPQITLSQPGRIYYDDPGDRPFATDASRFALFCALVARLLHEKAFGQLDVIHLHDWHTTALLLLKQFTPGVLEHYRYVYTVHNLAIQGIRPLQGEGSALRSWFPGLLLDKSVLDPRWTDCVNLMRAGINLAHKVHVVSPSYAQEVLRPNDEAHGFHGGEGLEEDMQRADAERRLVGILNGCTYPGTGGGRRPALRRIAEQCEREVLIWAAAEPQVRSTHLIALTRLAQLRQKSGQTLVTAIGRITPQKLRLLQEDAGDGVPVLHRMLEHMGDDGSLVLLGAGDAALERFLTQAAARYDNFVFLNGFSERLSETLYGAGRLFLMPSSFEPCGIAQMLAMRRGQPCLANLVGGLRDTVQDGVNGYGFAGDNLHELTLALLRRFIEAFADARQKNSRYEAIAKAAQESRFLWQDAARRYMDELYG